MSVWTTPNKKGFGTWDDSVETWDDEFTNWAGSLDAWLIQKKNSSTFTQQAKNIVSSTEQEFLIDDTYSLQIDGTYELLIQSGGAGYTAQSKNISVYTLQNVANTKIENQELLIDGTYELLIDDNFILQIQSEGVPENWQLQTKN